MRRRILLAAFGALAAMAAFLAGCGGSGSLPGGGNDRSAEVRVAVRWPEVTRALPVTAMRVVMTARSGGTVLGTAETSRAPAQSQAQPSPPGILTLANLPVGVPLTFTFEAFGDPAFGNPRPVASAVDVVTLSPGLNQRSIVLDSTISTLSVAIAAGPPISGSGSQADPYRLTLSDTAVPLGVQARDGAGGLVLLRYDQTNPSADPQLAWSVSGPPLSLPGGATGVDVTLGVTSPLPGIYAVTVTYTDLQDPAISKSTTAYFRISLETETLSRFLAAPTTLTPVPDAADVDVAARATANGDQVFVLGGTPSGSQFSTTTVTTSGGVPQFAPAPDLTAPGLVLRRIARHADPFGFLATDGNKTVFTFKRYPSNSQNLVPERTLDFGASPIAGVNLEKIEDIDAAENETSFYVLYTPPGGNALQIARINKEFNGQQFLRSIVVGGSPPSVPRRVAVFQDTAQPIFFVLSDNQIRLYVGQAAASAPLGIPAQGASNPSGESLGTILDIATSGSSLYVLSDTPKGARVHLFTIDARNPANVTAAYSRSRLVDDDNDPATPVRIRSLVSTTGTNDIYVAILNSQGRPTFVAATEL